MGTRKLYELLEPFMYEAQIKMGRDALFNLLAANNLLVRKRKRRIHTTNSFHWLRKWPNLIKDITPHRKNQIWVSDITYWKAGFNTLCINLITDAYSRKIVGYHLADNLGATESIKALEMALKISSKKENELIHHSDRGVQYCSSDYVKLLQKHSIKISMTENGDPLENAIAERVNGILKDEYLECYQVQNIDEATELLNQTVQLYNEERPHMSIGNNTPSKVHETNLEIKRLWKNYYRNEVEL